MNKQGTRVDLKVMELRPDLTRTTIKKLIINGTITVNRNKIMPNYRMQEDDLININENEIKKSLVSDDFGLFSIKPKNLKLEVLYEDSEIIAINKPSGINSHPANRKDTDTALNGIGYILSKKEINTDRIRLLHRLDKETSGVLMATKNLEAHDYYSKQFENHSVRKEYFAIVHGDFLEFLERKGKQDLYIATNISIAKGARGIYFNTNNKDGRAARSTVYFHSHFNKFGKRKFSIVRIHPETGRTHQIRVHLSSVGFPILGDVLYKGQKFNRLMLHSFALEVTKKTGQRILVTAPLPEEFELIDS